MRARLAWLLAGVLVVVAVAAAAAGGCRPKAAELWFRPDPGDLPGEVATWVENSRPLFAAQTMPVGEVTYVLIGWGDRPEGDRVEITGIEVTPGGPADVLVTLRFTGTADSSAGTGGAGTGGAAGTPGTGDCPQDLATVNLPNADVAWAVEGDPDAWIPKVLAPVEPIVAGSQWIKLFTPAPGEVVSSGFLISGLSNVFEGTVNYRLVLGEGESAGEVIDQGYATGAMGDWGRFEGVATFPQEVSGRPATLEVFWVSPADGSRQGLFQVPLTLGAAGPGAG